MTKAKPTKAELESAYSEALTPRSTAEAWVFYVYSDAPPMICGSGMGAFHWFQDREAMFDFVGRVLSWWQPGPSSDDETEIANGVREIISTVSSGSNSAEALRVALNDHMRHLWQIPWWGTFADLATGPSEFAVEIRSRFLAELLSETADGREPLPRTTWLRFAEWLAEYGM